MAKDFDTLKTNVTNEIGDTDSEMKEIVGVYINNRYKQVLRATNWEIYNDDYTITTIAGTASYTLEDDFGKELLALDTTNNTKLKRIDYQTLIENNPSDYASQGGVSAYAVFRTDDDVMKVRFYNVPNAVLSIAFPYVVRPIALSATTDTPIADFDDIIELGAKADAWRYKRQFAKSQYFDVMFNQAIDSLLWDMENQPNASVQFGADPYDREGLYE